MDEPHSDDDVHFSQTAQIVLLLCTLAVGLAIVSSLFYTVINGHSTIYDTSAKLIHTYHPFNLRDIW